MLSVEGLEVRYGRIVAVHDVSLEVHEGEVVGLIGPNGAGKTSTLSAIAGLVRPAAGRIRFEGNDLVGRVPEQIFRYGLVLVPEGRHVFATLTVGENLGLGLGIRPDREQAARDMERELERFPVLRRTKDTMAGALSGGEQQQLAIARALIARPRLLVLDEPSLGLAPLVVDEVFAVLEQLRRDGVTVLLVEQNATRTLRFADRSYVMRNGTVALAGTEAELGATAELESAYLGI
jgi:branched-chain amino acid transport system ATP-binding protein